MWNFSMCSMAIELNHKIKDTFEILILFEKYKQGIISDLLSFAFELNERIQSSPNRPLYDFNFVEEIAPDEPLTSKYLRKFFIFKDIEGKNIMVYDFAKRFLNKIGFKLYWIDKPQIKKEYRHIDLLIKEEGKYAIIIENKIKGAIFQRNQLGRYIQTLLEEGFKEKQIFIVILPKEKYDIDNIRKSVWNVPTDWQIPNGMRVCGIDNHYDCWCDRDDYLEIRDTSHCAKCDRNLKERFHVHTLILHKEFGEWLISVESVINHKEIGLRSALLQFGDYLKKLYKTENNYLLQMEIKKFLREQLDIKINKDSWLKVNDTLKDLDVLSKNILNLKKDLSSQLIDKWHLELKEKWPDMEYKKHISFGLNLKNEVWLGCYFKAEGEGIDMGDDGQPFWGFKNLSSDSSKFEKQKEMVEKILERADMGGKISGNWIRWNNTLSGAERCNDLFQVAKDLDYLL